jgi:hypothetical protein
MFEAKSQRNAFLEQTKAARDERAAEKKKEAAAVKIQSHVRRWLQQKRFSATILLVPLL